MKRERIKPFVLVFITVLNILLSTNGVVNCRILTPSVMIKRLLKKSQAVTLNSVQGLIAHG